MSPHTRLASRAFWQVRGFQLAPEARQRTLDDRTLNYYYEADFAYRRMPQGIEVRRRRWASQFARGSTRCHTFQSDWWEIPTRP
jgi:hypothetical protein